MKIEKKEQGGASFIRLNRSLENKKSNSGAAAGYS